MSKYTQADLDRMIEDNVPPAHICAAELARNLNLTTALCYDGGVDLDCPPPEWVDRMEVWDCGH